MNGGRREGSLLHQRCKGDWGKEEEGEWNDEQRQGKARHADQSGFFVSSLFAHALRTSRSARAPQSSLLVHSTLHSIYKLTRGESLSTVRIILKHLS